MAAYKCVTCSRTFSFSEDWHPENMVLFSDHPDSCVCGKCLSQLTFPNYRIDWMVLDEQGRLTVHISPEGNDYY